MKIDKNEPKSWAEKRQVCIIRVMLACLEQNMPDLIKKNTFQLVSINVTGFAVGALAPRYGAHLNTLGNDTGIA